MEIAFLKNNKVLTIALFDDSATDADIQTTMEGSIFDADSFKKLAFNEYLNNEGELDFFEKPAEFPSWVWNATSKCWLPPKERPEGNFKWDEQTLNWVAVQP